MESTKHWMNLRSSCLESNVLKKQKKQMSNNKYRYCCVIIYMFIVNGHRIIPQKFQSRSELIRWSQNSSAVWDNNLILINFNHLCMRSVMWNQMWNYHPSLLNLKRTVVHREYPLISIITSNIPIYTKQMEFITSNIICIL